MLGIHELAGVRVDDEAQWVPHTQRVDFGLVSRFADERVVGGHAAIVIQAEDFSAMGARILGAFGGPDLIGPPCSESRLGDPIDM